MTRPLTLVAAAVLSSLLSANTAHAGVFVADYDRDGVWTGYNTNTSTYGVKFRDDGSKDGFWLVVSDGSNPKGAENEYAILYGDRNANRITAYTYDGENNENSYQNGTLIGTYENVFTDAGQHPTEGYDLTGFNLDVLELNSAFANTDWDGVLIGETAGIWFHQSSNSNFEYDADGAIIDYTFSDQTYLDRGNTTTYTLDCLSRPDAPACESPTSLNILPNSSSSGGGSVPAPGGLALVLVGLVSLRRMRLRKKASSNSN